MTPAIRAFLDLWKETRGFGQAWELDVGTLRSGGGCCPLTAEENLDAGEWASCYQDYGLGDDEGGLLIVASDMEPSEVAEEDAAEIAAIRAELLAGVGLKEDGA